VGIVLEAFHEHFHLLVHIGVDADFVRPHIEFGGRGEFSIDQEIGGLQKRAFLREFFDRVTAVFQDAPVAVNKGNGATA
jgi:hypothetical protein